MTEDLKEEIINVMKPLFGGEVVKILNDYYESDKPQEIIKVAHKMLSDFMGEENADATLESILNKFPKLKVNLH